jgi:hypothetical protein
MTEYAIVIEDAGDKLSAYGLTFPDELRLGPR